MKTRGTAITAGIIGAVAIAGGGIALATSAQEPFSENAFEVTGQNENLDVTVDGVVQPGEELLIAATCPGQDVRADLDTSFGESTTMSPGADVGKLAVAVWHRRQCGQGILPRKILPPGSRGRRSRA